MKDILDFIQSIIESLAWPIATIIGIVILKRPISNTLKRLSKLTYKEAELDFVTEFNSAKKAAKSIGKNFDSSKRLNFSINKTLIEEIEQIASISPQASIPLAWSMLESEITNLIKGKFSSIGFSPSNGLLKNLQLLKDKSLIDNESYELIKSLSKLRNETINKHGDIKLSVDDAIEYAKMSEMLSKKIKEINNK